MPKEHSPPRLARRLLRLLVRDEIRQEVEGDLEELFRRRLRDDGVLAARMAYWKQILSPTLLRLRRESAGVTPTRGAPVTSNSGDPLMQSLARDFRFAFRILSKSPGFTAVAILSIALGVGPNTAVFSMVNGVLFGGEEMGEPEEVAQVFLTNTEEEGYSAMYHSTYETIVEGTDEVFQGVTAFTNVNIRLGDEGDRLALGELVTGNYFDVLQVEPRLGRGFLPEEDATPGTHPVVVLSHRLWQSDFGSDPGIVGSEIRLNGRPYTVVGVAPPEFEGEVVPGIGTDLWVPLRMYPHLRPGQMGYGNLWTFARVREGVPVERAVAVVDALATRVRERIRAESNPESRFDLEAVPVTEIFLTPEMDRTVFAMAGILLGAVGLVLLIACTNLAAFFLARATDRRKEMAVRVALGAGRRAITRQLLVESLVLAAVGGALGLGLGVMVVQAVESLEPPIGVPLNLDLGLDLRVLLFTGGVTLLAGLVFGLAPAVRASRAPVASTLRDESAGGGQTPSKLRGRNLLVAAQVALSLVLLVGAGLFVRSLRAAATMDPGFDTGPAGIVTVNAGASGYEPEELPEFNRDLMNALLSEPGLTHVAASTRLPLELGVNVLFLDIPGVQPPEGSRAHRLEVTTVSSGYFETMDVEILEGRGFTTEDEPEAAIASVLLSRAAAERYWPGEEPLGKTMYRAGDPEQGYRVVGITENVKIWSLTEPPRPYMYLNLAQNPTSYLNLVARGPQSAPELVGNLRRTVREFDPELFVPQMKTMEEHLGFILYLPRMAAVLLGAFGALALVLASVGLYGLVSYSVARRTREVGIRMALGADRRKVLALAMKGGLVLVVLGGAAGLAAALGGASLIQDFLIGIHPLDPVTFATVPLILGAVALLAAYLPARRATRVNPVEALRTE